MSNNILVTDDSSVVVPVWPYYFISLDDGDESIGSDITESAINWKDEGSFRIDCSNREIQIVVRDDVWFKDDQLEYRDPHYVAPERSEEELDEEEFYRLPVTVQGRNVPINDKLILAYDSKLTLQKPVLVVGDMMNRSYGANIYLPRNGQWHLQLFIDKIVETMEVTIRICDPIGEAEVEYHDDYHLTYEVI